MEVYIIDLAINLLLPHVVLTLMTTYCSKSTDSFTMKLLHTNTLVCDFQNSTQRFRSSIVVDLMQQLYSIARSIVCIRSLIVASKRFGKTTKHCPFECEKTCYRVCIYISLRSIKTLDLMAKKESESSDLHVLGTWWFLMEMSKNCRGIDLICISHPP